MDRNNGQALHLPDLRIRNFRGINSLSIRRLGRVTLIAGRNGVGKTTLLEAVKVFAERGSANTLSQVLWKYDEYSAVLGEGDAPVLRLDYLALFNGRCANAENSIWIGPNSGKKGVKIQRLEHEDLTDEMRVRLLQMGPDWITNMFESMYGGVTSLHVPLYGAFKRDENWPTLTGQLPHISEYHRTGPLIPFVPCIFLGPGLPLNTILASYWDQVAATDAAEGVINALKLIHDGIERIVAVAGTSEKRRLVAKLRSDTEAVPFNSLGNGLHWLFSVAVAIANSRNGFLLIDEVENGLHHSIHEDVWRTILRAASDFNVQILATTHSFDCVKGFAKASAEQDECVLVRIDQHGSDLNAVEYSYEEFSAAAEHSIEVR